MSDMPGRRKRVLVIGAGASGLPSLKTCLESGLDAVCVERQADLGGLWNYKAGETSESSVMNSTSINTSKEMMSFSDFPPPRSARNFMHHSAVLEYFRAYVRHFGLAKHMRFNTSVLSVHRPEGFARSQRWAVRLRDEDGRETEELFDGVMVCTGHHAAPHQARFKGEASFTGQVVHSHSYKDPRGWEGKRAVVVGVGNSGCDIAVELSRVCQSTHLSTRRGTWVFNRLGFHGLPIDTLTMRRAYTWLAQWLPWTTNAFWEWVLNLRFDHGAFGLLPRHGVLAAHPTTNDDLPLRIQCGALTIKPDVQELRGGSVIFKDGSVVRDVDLVVAATGYSLGFPCLEGGRLVPVEANRLRLWQLMYPPQTASPSLAIIGCVQPFGALMPIAEMQARVFVEILEGRAKTAFPSREAMEASIEAKQRLMDQRYVGSRRHTIQVDYVAYMDELGRLIGATPSAWGTLLRGDVQLALELFLGPCLPYHFRLTGPKTWPEARETILSAYSRMAPEEGWRRPRDASGTAIVRGCLNFILLPLIVIFALFFFGIRMVSC